jgi:hypothetical protein
MDNTNTLDKVIEGTFTLNLSVLKGNPLSETFKSMPENDQRVVFNSLVKDLIEMLNTNASWAVLSVEV